MLKNLYEIARNLLPLPLFLAVIAASASRLKSPKARKWHSLAVAALFVLALVFSILRDKRVVKYNQIHNVRLIICSIIFCALYCAFQWILLLRKSASGGGRLQNAAAAPAGSDGENETGGRAEIVRIVAEAAGLVSFAALLFYRLPPMAALPFHFVGMDESYWTTDFLLRTAGFAIAFLLLFSLFLCAYKVLLRSAEKWTAASSLVFFLANASVLLVSLVGIINSYYRRKFALPAFVKKNLLFIFGLEEKILLCLLALLAMAAAAFLLFNLKIHGEWQNQAERRKLRARAKKNRRWAAGLFLLCAFFCIDLTAIKKASRRVAELSPSEEYQIDGEEIFIPLEQVSDGHLHRFTWTNQKGKAVRFIIVQKKGTNFGVGFDACEICGNVGYYERKNEVVCNRCDVVMNKSTIGLKGGCNPIPLASKIDRGGIIILTSDLDKEAKRF